MNRWAAPLLGAASFALVVAARLHLPLLEPEEGLYAVVPRDMLAAGEVVVPTLRGQPYLDKPPLLYWAVMACYAAFGTQVWAARLAPALAAWLTLAVVYAWGRACGGARAGLTCAAALALTGDFLYRSPMVTPNGLLALATTSALALGHLALRNDRVRSDLWFASALATGLGTLTKGPIALVLVAGPLFVLARLFPNLARPTWRHAALYAVGVMLVAGPWFALASARHPDFAEYFFWRHHVQRFAAPFDHAKPVHFYLPQLALGGLPWTLALASLVRAREGRGRFASNPDAWFALLAALAGFAFLSLAGSKRPAYLVPLWPPLAFASGMTLAAFTERRRLWLGAGAGLAVTFAFASALWLPRYHAQFSAAPAADRLANCGGTIVCHPHAWNSLDFVLAPHGVATEVEPNRERLWACVRRAGSVVVVAKASVADELATSLPPDLAIVERRRVGIVSLISLCARSAD